MGFIVAYTGFNIRCSVVTPDALIVDDEVSEVRLPGHDGGFGVLPGHAPMLFKLGLGIIRLHYLRAGWGEFLIEGGFAHVCDNEVTVFTRGAIGPKQMGEAEAEEALRRAQVMDSATIEQVEVRSTAIQRAKLLEQLVQPR